MPTSRTMIRGSASHDSRGTAHPGRGFTLMEVMATLVIISVVLLSILAIRSRNLQDAAEARDTRFAGLLAQRTMEQALLGIEPDYEDVPEAFNVSVTNLLESVGDEQEIVEVIVEVTYPSREGEEAIILTSYRMPFEGEEIDAGVGE